MATDQSFFRLAVSRRKIKPEKSRSIEKRLLVTILDVSITIIDCQMKSKNISPLQLFESWHVTDIIVGIPMPTLNLFLQRCEVFGITARVSGQRKKSSRRFDAEDVIGIGLAWMLSKSGLRAEVIRQILCDITQSEVAIASEAAIELFQSGHSHLVVLRGMPVTGETVDEAEVADLTTEVCYLEDLPELLTRNVGKSALVFPIEDLFDRIEIGMDVVEQVLARRNGPTKAPR